MSDDDPKRRTGPVLVVHDDPASARGLARVLTSVGMAAVTAGSDVEAFARLRVPPCPGVVVLDFSSPGRSEGIVELLVATASRPMIVALTGEAMAPRARLIEAGVDACVVASRAQDDLPSVVRRLLAGRASESAPPRGSKAAVAIGTWDEYRDHYAADLAAGRMFVPSDAPISVARPVTIELGLPDGRVVELAAEVSSVVSLARARASGKRSGMSVRFTDASEDAAKRIAPPAAITPITPPAPVAPHDVAPVTLPSPVPDAGRGAELARALRSYLDEIGARDHYGALGVPRDAAPDAIRGAYHALVKHLHPTRYAREDDAVRDAATEVFLRIKLAYEVLSSPEKNALYRSRATLDARPPPGQVALMRILALRGQAAPPADDADRTNRRRPWDAS